MKKTKYLALSLVTVLSLHTIFAQEKNQKENSKEDRNVMLNAANNTGPRDVNIGLPASVGGTTVLENGLPVVYFFWPELPIKAWRHDLTINKTQLLDLGQTAINIGEVGFSVSTYDNLGTDKFQFKGSMHSNHFGLTRDAVHFSGPLNKKGLKFTTGGYVSLDPGTFDAEGITKYYADRAQLYKAGLTQDYTTSNGKGSVSALYKYAKVEGIRNLYAPFLYGKNGKVKEISGFKIGGDSYLERNQKINLMDAYTGEMGERDIVKDYGSESHTVDVIWKHALNSGLNFNTIVRYHSAKTGNYLPIMTGVSQAIPGTYTYEDGTPYLGENVQGVLILGSRRVPIQSIAGTFEVSKKSGKHSWKAGINQWNYEIDKYATETVQYFQEVASNPRKLVKKGNTGGNFNYNAGLEYHNGTENKTALFLLDKWDVTDLLTLNLGGRLEYQNLRGDYQNRDLGLTNLNGPKTKIKKDWVNKAFMLSGIYKVTSRLGVLGEATYNEQAGHLENYNIGVDPEIKKSKIPGAGLGVFFNHPLVSIVSKATYIKRDEYRGTVNFTHPQSGLVSRSPVRYDIETIGWTTDISSNPFKNFNLHFLFTLQTPKYKNYSGIVNFSDGTKVNYNFEDKIVNGVSKVLIEIDPSYIWGSLRVWGSARYFSKTYANLPNSLYFEGRWETFAGAQYKITKNLQVNTTIVNLLNQRGAQGSISGTDLVDAETARQKEGTILSGTYIRPFTVEFGVNFNF